MDKDLEELKRTVEEIRRLIVSFKNDVRANIELEVAIRKAIADLEETKKSVKSKQIMHIKEELERALENKRRQ